ncbi:MAG TPA: hypothetical protein VKZ63_15540 [Kofleriaceae bacterium]|nr:hypothetical protein [Kofleriaceae bacterium]
MTLSADRLRARRFPLIAAGLALALVVASGSEAEARPRGMSRADKQDVARTAGRLQGVDSAARAALIKDGATPQILVRFTTQGRKGKERELTPAQAGARAVSRKASRRPVKAQIVKEWRTADGTKRRAVTSARKLKTAADWAALRQDVATHMGARIADLSRPYRGGKGFDPSFDVARGIRRLAFVQMAKGAGIFAMVLATPALVGGSSPPSPTSSASRPAA